MKHQFLFVFPYQLSVSGPPLKLKMETCCTFSLLIVGALLMFSRGLYGNSSSLFHWNFFLNPSHYSRSCNCLHRLFLRQLSSFVLFEEASYWWPTHCARTMCENCNSFKLAMVIVPILY